MNTGPAVAHGDLSVSSGLARACSKRAQERWQGPSRPGLRTDILTVFHGQVMRPERIPGVEEWIPLDRMLDKERGRIGAILQSTYQVLVIVWASTFSRESGRGQISDVSAWLPGPQGCWWNTAPLRQVIKIDTINWSLYSADELGSEFRIFRTGFADWNLSLNAAVMDSHKQLGSHGPSGGSTCVLHG